ncbi:MAG: DUF1501 domain-containing protein [Planctomycetes bacterium]|nr:DUF1501 domain-containing protein [Planctomycetota bacterium]
MATVKQDRKKKKKKVSRRDFLRVGGLGVVGLSVAQKTALARTREKADQRNCIVLLMTGGPSQLETFDPKPEMPSEIRGPMKAISTAVPGVLLSESLPRMAERADRFSILRSLHHEAAPIHETGLQLLQTGRLARDELRHPSFGSVVSRTLGPRDDIAPYVMLPKLLGNTGVNAYQGQQAGFLGTEYDPFVFSNEEKKDYEKVWSVLNEPDALRRAYGETRFGRLMLQSRRLIEEGVRCVTVNLFDTLSGEVTWDCHGNSPTSPATLYDYRDVLCPQFDKAFSALLDDLQQRGLLEETLVVAAGEFGRTPRINEHGGRDHWPGVFSAVVAGGGVQGGQVIGASDSRGESPKDRPIELGELTATIYHSLGFDPKMNLSVNDETELPLVDHPPISELFG